MVTVPRLFLIPSTNVNRLAMTIDPERTLALVRRAWDESIVPSLTEYVRIPHAQFLITGVLGPGSNAHGPNEFLHLPTGVRLTACVAQALADHYRSGGSEA